MMNVVSVVLYIPFESHNSAALRESYQFAFNLHLIKLVMHYATDISLSIRL